MKRLSAVVMILIFLVLSGSSLVTAADVIKLKAANYIPVTHKHSLLMAEFCEQVKNKSNGRLEITYYPGGTLLNPVKMYDGLVTGIADIGYSHAAYTRGRFPVTEVFSEPLGFPSGWVASQVTNEFYKKYAPKEWNEVQVLYLSTSGPLVLLTVNKAVRTLEDLKGMKIRATGQMSDIIKALGAIPVPLEMSDVYDALRRAVIDGISVDLSTLKYWKFSEVVKYVTANWQLGSGYPFYVVMNKKKWNALPDDLKKIVTETASEIAEKHHVSWNDMDLEGKAALKNAGGEVLTLPDAEAARWVKAVEPVLDSYKKTMASKGYSEAQVSEWYTFIRERTEYWKKEEKKRGVPLVFE